MGRGSIPARAGETCRPARLRLSRCRFRLGPLGLSPPVRGKLNRHDFPLRVGGVKLFREIRLKAQGRSIPARAGETGDIPILVHLGFARGSTARGSIPARAGETP